MRPIHLARMDETRPVLVLTRAAVRDYLTRVTVAPITTTVKGLKTEVLVGTRNGLDQDCAVSCDNLMTIAAEDLGRFLGVLHADQEQALSRGIGDAFELE